MSSLMSKRTREIIHVGVGQAGVQAQQVFWEIACKEHNIFPDGISRGDRHSNSHEILFQETSDEKYFPRTLFIDAEPTCAEVILNGRYKNLFDQKDFICGKRSSANNYAIGRNSTWKTLYQDFDESFSSKYESCDNLKSLISINSICGGTGSGTCSAINFALDSVLRKVLRISATVYPSQVFSTSTVEQYNAAFALKDDSNQVDFNIVYDNLGLYRTYCNAKCKDVRYEHLNDLIGQSISDITCSDRFHGPICSPCDNLTTNLCPFPMLKYITPGINQLRANSKSAPKVSRVTYDVFNKHSSLNGYNHVKGINSAIFLVYRGDASPSTCAMSIAKARIDVDFFSWSGNGIKFGVCPKQQMGSDSAILKRSEMSCSRYSNNTIINKCFGMIQKKFDSLHRLHSFIHWYTREAGFEELEFSDTVEFLENLQDTYNDLGLLDSSRRKKNSEE